MAGQYVQLAQCPNYTMTILIYTLNNFYCLHHVTVTAERDEIANHLTLLTKSGITEKCSAYHCVITNLNPTDVTIVCGWESREQHYS